MGGDLHRRGTCRSTSEQKVLSKVPWALLALGADRCGTQSLRLHGCWWTQAGVWAGSGSASCSQAHCWHPLNISEGSVTGLLCVSRAKIQISD